MEQKTQQDTESTPRARAAHAESIAPDDIEPDAFVRCLDGGWVPLSASATAKGGDLLPVVLREPAMEGINDAALDRYVSEGKAVRAVPHFDDEAAYDGFNALCEVAA